MSTRASAAPVAVVHFAGRVGDHNDSAMAASPRLAEVLARHFDATPVVIGAPRPARSAQWDVELESSRDELRQLGAHVDAVLAGGAKPVVALSRCAAALATLPAVARHRPDAVVVWFDAHADINTPASTESGYLGGLALSGPLGLWDSGLGAGLAADRTVLAGTRDIDAPELETIETSALALVPPGDGFAERLEAAVAGRPVYVHIDCDVLDPGIVPTDYRVPNGLGLPDLAGAASALARCETVGIEIGELETRTGGEDLDPLLEALAPLLDRL